MTGDCCSSRQALAIWLFMVLGEGPVAEVFRAAAVAELALLVVNVVLGRPQVSAMVLPIALAGLAAARPWNSGDMVIALGYAVAAVWRVLETVALVLARAFAALRRERPLRVLVSHRTESALMSAATLGWLTGFLLGLLLVGAWVFVWARLARLPEFRSPEVQRGAIRATALGVLLVMSAASFAVASGQLKWVEADTSEVVPQLIAIQLALGLVPLTALLVLAQLASAAYGPRSYRVLPYWRTAGVLLCLTSSIAIDVVILGGRDSRLVELSELLALNVTIAAALMTVHVIRQLDWRHVAVAFIRRLDLTWLRSLIGQYENRFQELDPAVGDATTDVERLLYLAATRDSDVRRFRQVVGMAAGQIRAMRRQLAADAGTQAAAIAGTEETAVAIREHLLSVPRKAEVALDRHLARSFAALVVDLAREQKPWALETLVDFRRDIGLGANPPAQVAPIVVMGGEHDGFPSGCELCGAVATHAVEQGLEEVAASAIYAVTGYVSRSLTSLPSSSGVTDVDSSPAGFNAELPGEHYKDAIEQYLSRIESLATLAVRNRLTDVLRSISFVIQGFQEDCRRATDPRWVDWLTHRAAWCSYQIAIEARDAGLLAYRIPHPVRPFELTSEVDKAWLSREIYMIPVTLITVAPVVQWILVSEVAGLARDLLAEFPEETSCLAAGLRVLDERVALLPDTAGRRAVRREVSRRLNQLLELAGDGRQELEEQIVARVPGIRQEVGEP